MWCILAHNSMRRGGISFNSELPRFTSHLKWYFYFPVYVIKIMFCKWVFQLIKSLICPISQLGLNHRRCQYNIGIGMSCLLIIFIHKRSPPFLPSEVNRSLSSKGQDLGDGMLQTASTKTLPFKERLKWSSRRSKLTVGVCCFVKDKITGNS